MKPSFFAIALIIVNLAASCAVVAQTLPPTTQPSGATQEIDQLILQLGDRQYTAREEASRKLGEMGDEIIPALQAAMNDSDPEVAQRARTIFRNLNKLTPERRAKVAALALEAYTKADYPAAARQQAILARNPRASIDECITLGHYWQLANRWPESVAGYLRALERIEQVIAGDPENDPPPQAPPGNGINGPGGFGGGGRGPGLVGNGARGLPGLSAHEQRELFERRAGLMLLIGRLQREKLNDPSAAAVTFARVIETASEFQGTLATLLEPLAADVALRRAHKDVPHDIGRGLTLLNEFDTMEELARTQEKLGQTDAAILTLARLSSAMLHTRDDGVDANLAMMSRLIAQSPTTAKMPGAAALIKLTPPPIEAAQAPSVPSEPYVNAASPFKWTRTNLGDFKLGAVAVRDVVRLPDKRWLSALTAGGQVLIATSRDLVTWDAPLPIPHNGIANNIEPALVVDGQGVIWLAWFSNRLSLNPRSSGGYQLWLTHLADARDWSPPRAISADTGGWPMGALHWLHTGDGHFRLSWRAAAATVVAPADLKGLSPIQMFVPEQLWPMDPQVSQDDAGNLHMVLDDRMRGVTYAHSEDAKKWSEPVVLIDKITNGPGMDEPHLLIQGPRAALIYQVGSDSFLRRGFLSKLTVLEPPIQIGAGAASTGGSRWVRDGDDIVGFASGQTPWLLRGKSAAVFSER